MNLSCIEAMRSRSPVRSRVQVSRSKQSFRLPGHDVCGYVPGQCKKMGTAQAVEIDWQVGGVAAMGHEDLDTAVQGNLYILQQGRLDFSRMIAESMDLRVNIPQNRQRSGLHPL